VDCGRGRFQAPALNAATQIAVLPGAAVFPAALAVVAQRYLCQTEVCLRAIAVARRAGHGGRECVIQDMGICGVGVARTSVRRCHFGALTLNHHALLGLQASANTAKKKTTMGPHRLVFLMCHS